MKKEKLSIVVSGSIGAISAEVMSVPDMSFLFVFAHGAGAGMNHPFMVNLAEALCQLKIGSLRYNFPYMERGGKRPDPPAIAEKAVTRAIEAAREQFPSLPLLVGGKSFGGRMSSQALSKTGNPQAAAMIFTGFPLHAPGKPSTDRAAHLALIDIPMLFLQGTRDTLANIDLIEDVCNRLPKATLKRFEGADHSFKTGKQNLIPALATTIEAWCASVLRKK
jgi:uncharacterized protein